MPRVEFRSSKFMYLVFEKESIQYTRPDLNDFVVVVFNSF